MRPITGLLPVGEPKKIMIIIMRQNILHQKLYFILEPVDKKNFS